MFIKKRKITKASIEELAKRYPQNIISDEDARNIVAGVHYYSPSGAYLGQYGMSAEIRVLNDSNLFYELGNTGSLSEYNNPAYNNSCTLSSSSPSTQYAVVSQVARSVFGNSFVLETSGDNYNMAVITNTSTGERNVYMTFGKSYMDDMYSLRSTLDHEFVHYNDPNIMIGSGNAFDLEFNATIIQILGTDWESASVSYKIETFNYLLEVFKNANNRPMSESEKQSLRTLLGL